MADIKQVAARACVSIATVSRVINHSKNVNPELRRKVEEAIESLNYQTNTVARGLKVTKTGRIATIIPSLSRTFFNIILEGVTREAEKLGYSVVITETHDDSERESELVNLFANQWVDGIIIASSAYSHDCKTLDYIAGLSELRKKEVPIPVVSLEFSLNNPHVDAVIIDNEKAAFDATSYLINDLHRQNIVHISHPRGHFIGDLRCEGYRRALTTAGLPVRDSYILEGNYTTYSGYQAMRAFLSSGHPVDAFYCANDQTAVGVIKACEELGIRIPEDVAVIGMDDAFAASIVTPSLSSVGIPKLEIGRRAMELINDRIVNGMPPMREVIELDYELIERESTRKGARNTLKYLQW